MTQQTSKKQNQGKEKEYKERIIEHLQQSPSGLTITDIHNGINASRITVSKYISVLEAKGKVFSKKIGAYKLYFVTERSFIPKTPMLSYYAGLLSCIKSEFTDLNKFKEFGYIINDFMIFPFSSEIPEDIKQSKIDLLKGIFEYYTNIFPRLDLLMDKNVIIEKEIKEKDNSILIRLKNLKIFDTSENFDVHFYITSGITEKAFTKSFGRKVVCNVNKIDVSKKLVEFLIIIENND